MTKVLTQKELYDVSEAEIVEDILYKIRKVESLLELNNIKKRPKSLEEEKIRINNIIRLLHILVTKFSTDPLAAKLVLETQWLLDIFKKMQIGIIQHENFALGKQSPDILAKKIDTIILQTELWREELEKKIIIRPGNSHTHDTYHPEFEKTYRFIPSYLPVDYHSNFFFEVKIKEMCPYTTLIGFHPFSNVQSVAQDSRNLAELTRINIDVNFTSRIAIDRSDNLAGFRIHGPKENKKYPGSYIMIYGGHHRMRALYKKYLQNEVNGDLKVLLQLIPIDHFSMSKQELLAFIELEIKKRHKIRMY